LKLYFYVVIKNAFLTILVVREAIFSSCELFFRQNAYHVCNWVWDPCIKSINEHAFWIWGNKMLKNAPVDSNYTN